MRKFWWWLFKHVPLGRLAPYALGFALRSKPHRLPKEGGDG